MHFNLPNLMILVALVASFVLVFRSAERVPAFIALVAAAVEALIAFRLIAIHGPPHRELILAALLALGGAWSWLRAGTKPAVTAATIVALIGAVQLVDILA